MNESAMECDASNEKAVQICAACRFVRCYFFEWDLPGKYTACGSRTVEVDSRVIDYRVLINSTRLSETFWNEKCRSCCILHVCILDCTPPAVKSKVMFFAELHAKFCSCMHLHAPACRRNCIIHNDLRYENASVPACRRKTKFVVQCRMSKTQVCF